MNYEQEEWHGIEISTVAFHLFLRGFFTSRGVPFNWIIAFTKVFTELSSRTQLTN